MDGLHSHAVDLSCEAIVSAVLDLALHWNEEAPKR